MSNSNVNSGAPSGPHGGRPRGLRVAVWVTHDEKAEIVARAVKAGMSESAYLRAVGLGYQVRSVLDINAVADLVKVNGDLGRVAGLLKLWLLEKSSQGASPTDVEAMMNEFCNLQGRVLEIIGKVADDC